MGFISPEFRALMLEIWRTKFLEMPRFGEVIRSIPRAREAGPLPERRGLSRHPDPGVRRLPQRDPRAGALAAADPRRVDAGFHGLTPLARRPLGYAHFVALPSRFLDAASGSGDAAPCPRPARRRSCSLSLLTARHLPGFAAGRGQPHRAPVLIDTDPGTDDAMAILLALNSPELDVRAFTVVGGNVPQAQALENALRLVSLAGRCDIPIARRRAAAPGPEAHHRRVRAREERDGQHRAARLAVHGGQALRPGPDHRDGPRHARASSRWSPSARSPTSPWPSSRTRASCPW